MADLTIRQSLIGGQYCSSHPSYWRDYGLRGVREPMTADSIAALTSQTSQTNLISIGFQSEEKLERSKSIFPVEATMSFLHNRLHFSFADDDVINPYATLGPQNV